MAVKIALACPDSPDPNDTPAGRVGRCLASRIGPHRYDMWFSRARLNVHGRRLEVATDSPFVAKWIGDHFTDDLRDAASEVLGAETPIDVKVAPELFESTRRDLPGDPDESTASRRKRDRSTVGRSNEPSCRVPQATRPRRIRRPTLRRLEQFVVGQCNRLAYATALRLIDETENAPISPLFIHGECGVGKTHLLQGICMRHTELTGRPGSVRYVTGEQFTNEYIYAVRNNALDEFRNKIRQLDLLAIDDVHFLSNKVRTQSEFLHTLDAIDLTGAKIVLASDEHPRLIRKFSQALVSRFLSGMVVQIERPDRNTRIELVRRLTAHRNLSIQDAALDAVAGRCVGSVRELEGAITKLTALRMLASEMNGSGNSSEPDSPRSSRDIGLVLVEQLFKDHGWKPRTPIRMQTVIDVIVQRLAVNRTDLIGSSRHRRVVLARGLIAYFGRELTTHSYPEIARAIGRAYHSTVHTAEQRLHRLLGENAQVDAAEGGRPMPLKELVDQMRHEISRAAAKA